MCVLVSHHATTAPQTYISIFEWFVSIRTALLVAFLVVGGCACRRELTHTYVVREERGVVTSHSLMPVASPIFETFICNSQSRIIGTVRGAHSQLWETTLPVSFPNAPRKYDKRFGTPAIV